MTPTRDSATTIWTRDANSANDSARPNPDCGSPSRGGAMRTARQKRSAEAAFPHSAPAAAIFTAAKAMLAPTRSTPPAPKSP